MKKRYSLHILLIFAIIVAISAFGCSPKEKGEPTSGATDQKPEDIRDYYYRSIPGLKRAEELDLVKPIHKTFTTPDIDATLKIDRIWLNAKNAYIFYHVENTEDIAYMGGFFSGDEHGEEFELHPRELIGTPEEKGVFSDMGFYSFLKIPSIDPSKDTFKDSTEDSSQPLLFHPSLYIGDQKFTFKAIDMGIVDIQEPMETFELESSVEIGENALKLYRLDAGMSFNRFYFTYTPINAEIIYGLKGHILTDKDESFIINTAAISMDNGEEGYYIETPPFNELPNSMVIQLESLGVIGQDSIQGIIDTQAIKPKKGVQNLGFPLGKAMETNFILKDLHFRDGEVELGLLLNSTKGEDEGLLLEVGNLFYKDQETLLNNSNQGQVIIPNVLSIENNFGEIPGTENNTYPKFHQEKDNSFQCILPIGFWDDSYEILISIDNLTYQKVLNQSLEIDLNQE